MDLTFGGHVLANLGKGRQGGLLSRLGISTGIFLSIALSGLAQGSLTIPATITGIQAESSSLTTAEPSPGAFSTFAVATTAGSFTAGTYSAWCLNSYGVVPNISVTYSAFSSEAVSSSNLASAGVTQTELNEINWLINN
ncbi:MAG: hypothetical protein WA324_24955, partial [Bryobacteraceae bacterium]